MDKKLIRQILIGLGAVLFFLGLSYAFVPEVLDGKIVNQGDIQHYVGMSREMTAWNDAHPDDPTYWTGSMFSGMPTAPVTVVNGGDATQPVYDFLLLGRRPATYLFIALLGGFLLMLSLGIDWLLAVGGAVAIGFCSYNFQIIQAGHNTKMQAIAFIPWVLAALIWTYKVALRQRPRSARKDRLSWWARTVLAASLFGLALSLEIKANHVQITYYLALMIALYAVTMIVWVFWKHRDQWKEFLAASALLLVLGGLGIATNANKLLPTYDYQPVSTRGGSELTAEQGESSQQGGNLKLEYATQWSYGWNELPNIFIPDWNGGGNGARAKISEENLKKGLKGSIVDSEVQDAADRALLLRQYGQEIDREADRMFRQYKDREQLLMEHYMYWGPQPFTAGPMYVGSITVFLFLLGLCLYDGREKWWLAVVTLLAMLLSVGYNSDGSHSLGIQALAFQLLPMYGKFRTVSMILILLQVTLPMLGFLVLDRILKRDIAPKRLRTGLGISLGITGGFALVALVLPRSFTAAGEVLEEGSFAAALAATRKSLLVHDALITLLLVIAVAAIIWWACQTPKKNADSWMNVHRRSLAAGAIGLLILLNMFSIGHRYLNDSHFVTPRDFKKAYAERPVDKEIKKKDPGRTARVLDLSGDTFNSAIASYHHRCIGGYSPAKLQRYDDLVTCYLWRETAIAKQYAGQYGWDEILGTLQMTAALNGKYIITPDGKEVVENPYAFGPAWFVENTVTTATPDEEIDALGEQDLSVTAVLGPDFAEAAPASLPGSEGDRVQLLSYAPNELRYRYKAGSERILVFSEIYHPDWVATLDGQPLPLLRADWVLRAAVVPAGEHDIVMRFQPAAYETGRAVSRATSVPLLLIVLVAAAACIWLRKEERQDS